jgi:tetratricopeptide (TPR) repeat protein
MASTRTVLLLGLLALGGCALGPPLEIESLTGAGAVELQAVPFHPQDDYYCGPASLLSVLEYSGSEPGMDALIQRVYLPDRRGSLQVELLAAARHFGRIAYVLPPEIAAVVAELEAGRPVLVLQNLAIPERPSWHYAVLVGFDAERNRFILRSGDRPRLEEPARRWMRQWDWAGRWAVVVLKPGELPARPDRDRLLRAVADFEIRADPEAVYRAWQAVLAWDSQEPLAWLGSGNSHYAREQWTEAIRAYRTALESDPAYLPARLNLARVLGRQGRPCEGLETLNAVTPEPGHRLRETHADLHRELREACGDR